MLLPPSRTQGVSRLLSEINTTPFSLREDSGTGLRHAQLMGRIAEYLLVALVVLIFAGMEVGRWYFNTPPQPLWVCTFAACITLYSAVRIWFSLPQLRTLTRERQARRLLRHAIDSLCAKGFIYFERGAGPHNLAIGPVIAGPTGLFCLIPRFVPRGHDLSEKIQYPDPATLLVGRHPVMADPLGHARRASSSLYALLSAEGLDTIPVQSIVIFPGWSIQQSSTLTDPDVLVTGDQSLESTIRNATTRLEPRDLIAVSLLLEKFAEPHPTTLPRR